MKRLKATITLDQIGNLISDSTIEIRVPSEDGMTTQLVSLYRERLPDETQVTYSVMRGGKTNSIRVSADKPRGGLWEDIFKGVDNLLERFGRF